MSKHREMLVALAGVLIVSAALGALAAMLTLAILL